MELPRKTEKQIRDRARTLKKRGLLGSTGDGEAASGSPATQGPAATDAGPVEVRTRHQAAVGVEDDRGTTPGLERGGGREERRESGGSEDEDFDPFADSQPATQEVVEFVPQRSALIDPFGEFGFRQRENLPTPKAAGTGRRPLDVARPGTSAEGTPAVLTPTAERTTPAAAAKRASREETTRPGGPPDDPPPSDPEDEDQDLERRDEDPWEEALASIMEIRPVCRLGAQLQELLRTGGETAEFDRLVEDFHGALFEAAPEKPRKTTGRGRRPGRAERTLQRITRYARTQEIMKKNPSRLAELVVKNNLGDLERDTPRAEPPKDGIKKLYDDLWGKASTASPDLPEDQQPSAKKVQPVTAEEVERRIRKLRPGGAPGPDRVTKAGLTNYRHAAGTLAVIYNAVLFGGFYPEIWKKNRTTLIPKPNKDLQKAENWRPITISPLPARMFSSVVEKRLLEQITLSDRQRGFRPGNGCHVNCWILDEVIRQGKKSEVVGVQLDLTKAFDTVAHSAITRILDQRGVSDCLKKTIKKMYADTTTSLGNTGATVAIRRGVKQGDPLSPLIFNLVVDPLMRKLEETGHGFRVGERRMPVIAYADDLTLFAANPAEMETLLRATADYLRGVGMAISPGKCGGFHIRKAGDAWVAFPTDFTIDGQRLQTFRADSSFTYLGLTFSIRRGFDNSKHLEDLGESAERVRRLSLKPHQKVQLLLQFVMPMFAHRMTINTPSKNQLEDVDAVLRREVKKILHLHPSTTDGLLYTRKKDGGLGFPRLVEQARICGLRAGAALLREPDPILQDLGTLGGWSAKVRRLGDMLGVPATHRPEDIRRAKQQLKDGAQREWAGLVSQGQGVNDFRADPVGNYWLFNQGALRAGQFISALQMRTNTCGTRVAINRAAKNAVTICRRCRTKQETLGHVLGECTAGKRLRIERHNWIVAQLEDNAKKRGLTVAREQSFTIEGQTLKPDLVIKTRDRALVVDVTLPYENGPSLALAALRKQEKYQPLLATVQRQLQATCGEVIPVVVGARGAMPKATVTGLKKLAFADKKNLVDLSMIAIRTSIDILRAHIDYTEANYHHLQDNRRPP